MIGNTFKCVCRPRGRGHTPARLPAVLLGLVLLTGCARLGLPGRDGGGTAEPAPAQRAAAAATTAQDPVVAFAAGARPGAEGRITLADGQPASVRLVRVYAAASGRECREVLVGSGLSERSQLVCRNDAGAWLAARPLLRGGGAARP